MEDQDILPPWIHIATKESINLHPALALVLLLIHRGTCNVCLSTVQCNRWEPFEGKVGDERMKAASWKHRLEMMLCLHFLGLGVCTFHSEAAVLNAAPTSMCCVHVIENRGGSMAPNRLSSCMGLRKKQPQT